MTSLVWRDPQRSALQGAWQPFDMLDELLAWQPVYSPAFDRLASTVQPRVEIEESADGYRFSADLPGVEEKDVDITVAGDRLTIRGTRATEAQRDDVTYHAYERSYGSFCRTFALPAAADPDRCEASLKNGVLTVLVAKRETHRPRKISLKSFGSKLKGILSGDSKTDG